MLLTSLSSCYWTWLNVSFIQFEIIPVLGLTSDFQLKSGHYVLCVMRPRLLFKPSLVIGFLYPPMGGGITARWTVQKSRIPHSGPLTPEAGNILFLLAVGENSGSRVVSPGPELWVEAGPSYHRAMTKVLFFTRLLYHHPSREGGGEILLGGGTSLGFLPDVCCPG